MIHKKKLYVNLVIPKYALSSKNDDDISKNEDDDDVLNNDDDDDVNDVSDGEE